MDNSTILQFGQAAQQARQERRFEDARENAEKAVALIREAQSKQMLIQGLMFLGQIERDTAQPEKALKYYKEAVGISREVDEPLRFAHTLRHLADLHCEMDKLDLAESFYNESLEIYRNETGASPGDLANAVRGFAVLKDATGADEEARALWKEARALYIALGLEEGVEECDGHLSK